MEREILLVVVSGIVAYLIGSISFASIFSHFIKHDDVRNYGSGNAGATNMFRTYGPKLGILTFLCDGIKGAGAVLIAKLIGGLWGMYIGAILVVIGHNWPIFFRFKGGKGVAATLGAVLVLVPIEAAICGGIAIILIAITKVVSACSLIGVTLLLIVTFIFRWGQWGIIGAVVILTAMIVFQHRSNIVRLINKTESTLDAPAKKIKNDEETQSGNS